MSDEQYPLWRVPLALAHVDGVVQPFAYRFSVRVATSTPTTTSNAGIVAVEQSLRHFAPHYAARK